MTYWAGNPDSFAWLNSSRPINPVDCDIYDDWRQGLNDYTNTYGAALVAKGPAAVQANFRTRRFVFARGLEDYGNDQSDCAPSSQGVNRATRFFNFLNFFPPQQPQMVDYFPGIGHDAPTIFNTPAGIQRFYYDNWDGSGNYAPDYGPRMMPGDDPYPDPNYASLWSGYTGPTATIDIPKPTPTPVKGSSAINAKVTNPASFMNYAGCYTDSPNRSLSKLNWSGNTSTTVEDCVAGCVNGGYTVAGIEVGTECYCGNYIQNGASLVSDKNCSTSCAGENVELCGGPWLLSIWNSGSLFNYTGAHLVPSVGPYNSIGCWTDNGGSRTLSGKVPALGNGNTIETCASACSGFNYFGVEFGQEVSIIRSFPFM
jgi:hypothetical protein